MPAILSLMPEFEEYLRNEKRSSVATRSAYLSDLRRLGRVVTKDVAEVILNDLRDYQRFLGQRNLTLRTVERKFACFSTFWKWLTLQGYVSHNIVELVKLPRRKRKIPRWLSEAELVRFVTTPVKGRYHQSEIECLREEVAWKTLAWLGLRRSELLNLRIRDLYLSEGKVVIRSAKGDRDRMLPITPALKPLLLRLIADRSAEEYVFPGLSRNGRWGITSFMNAFHSHLKNCALDKKGFKPHTLRHTFATHLSLQGVRIEIIRELLGHSDLKTTMIYLHTIYEDLQRGLNKFVLNSLQLSEDGSAKVNTADKDDQSNQ